MNYVLNFIRAATCLHCMFTTPVLQLERDFLYKLLSEKESLENHSVRQLAKIYTHICVHMCVQMDEVCI